MAIINSAQTVHPGFGAPVQYCSATGIVAGAVATTNIAATMVPALPLTVTARSGRIHMRATAAGGTGTITAITVTITDGTTTETVYFNGATWAAGAKPNLMIDWCTDILINSLTINVTMAVAAQTTTWDLEMIGTA